MPDHPFLVDVSGPFEPGQVRLTWCEESPPTRPELERMIAETWDRELERSRRRGAVLFDGPLVRYLRHRVEGGTLSIDVGPTDYRAFMGTNFGNPERAAEFGWDSYSNPIGTSALVISRDGRLVLGRRNERVACHAGYVHTFGGGMEADERLPDGTFDAFASQRRELREELGLVDAEVRRMLCLGLIRDPEVRQPELVFDVWVGCDAETLAGRIRAGDHHEEHTELLACADEPDAIVPFIQSTRLIAPIAIGALLLHGRVAFGDDWYVRARSALRNNPPS